jgi:hypothetical protein
MDKLTTIIQSLDLNKILSEMFKGLDIGSMFNGGNTLIIIAIAIVAGKFFLEALKKYMPAIAIIVIILVMISIK